MRLKKLKLVGFKSFADLAKLEFHEGVTAVVGPNGCGKSNIADAFRWVFGEQSAKSLRGGKMQDVIFAGTSQRKPLNYAEVVIILSDTEADLPLGYNEIAVGRRLYRNGNSEYRINDRIVRLKDIEDLFLDSGIGKNSFAIFEQGKIDQVIQLNPLERRYIFEEAAGILRFLQRKREALRRLEQTNLNTSRLKDIHVEVEKQIHLLEDQAVKARQYKECRAHLEALEKTLLVAKYEETQRKKEELIKKESEHLNQIESLSSGQEALQKSLTTVKGELAESENVLRAKNEAVYQVRSNKALKVREEQSYQERFKDAIDKEKRWKDELERVVEKKQARQVEAVAIQKSCIEVDQKKELIDKQLKEQCTKLSLLEADLVKARDQQHSFQSQLVGALQKENLHHSDVKQYTVRLENESERKMRALKRKEILAKQIFEGTQQLKGKQADVKALCSDIDSQKSHIIALENQFQLLNKEIIKEQNLLNSLQQEIQEMKARQKVLQRMRIDMEGFTAGSKKLLVESQQPKSALYGKIKALHEFLHIAAGYEALCAAALKPYAQTLVVNDRKDLALVLDYAKKQKLKDFSLVCLETIEQPNIENGIKPEKQSEKKNCDETHKDLKIIQHLENNTLISYLLRDIYIFDSYAEALSTKPMTAAVSRDEFYVDGKQVLFQAHQSENNVFMREAELKVLDDKLSVSEQQKLVRDLELNEKVKTRTSIHQEQMDRDKVIRKAEMSLLEANFILQRTQSEIEKTTQEIQSIDASLQALNQQLEELQQKLDSAKQAHLQMKIETSNAQKQSTVLQETLQHLVGSYKTAEQLLKEREALAHLLADEHKKLLHALHVMEVKDLESIEQEKRCKEEIFLSMQLVKELEQKQKIAQAESKEIEQLLAQVTKEHLAIEREVVSHRKKIEQIETSLVKHQKTFKGKEQDWNQVRLTTVQLMTIITTLEAESVDRYHKKMEEVKNECIQVDLSIETMDKKIKCLKQELEDAGDVNFASIDECERHKERYTTLNTQLDDLTTSKQELIQVIAELDGESRVSFKQTLESIRANFKKNFEILFCGGEADLELTDSSDVLEAGIEIIACPPGKQMRSIQLLSGGEKCLTALALLFAIFEVKPAPFCVLDEIDAPLDDANVDRFVQMVKHYVEKCQFIIITHNKKTMAAADALFGVSMEDRGVSKLLSLRFAEERPTVTL